MHARMDARHIIVHFPSASRCRYLRTSSGGTSRHTRGRAAPWPSLANPCATRFPSRRTCDTLMSSSSGSSAAISLHSLRSSSDRTRARLRTMSTTALASPSIQTLRHPFATASSSPRRSAASSATELVATPMRSA
uniref:Uncharacterized protein n=1 Tax=Arundo donax TaxID=35708 RepID=A0A0A9CLU1_ARUDO